MARSPLLRRPSRADRVIARGVRVQPDGSARWWRRVSRHSFTRFAAFGLLGLGIDVTLLWLLLRFVMTDRAVAVTIAFAVTYGVNFTLNRFFSFAAHAPVSGQLARFVPQVAADYLLTLASVEALAGLGLTIVVARILAGGTNAVLNYLAYRFWTFGRRRDDGPTAPGIPGP
jgi:putative flippase GtrA